ncbi:HugZ family protein [Agitococcus lubricus]|uniref:Uncharacterized protein n=1 Tax=Agitococcus lubricus TaxID=1077255 RepID=A0A2T5J265_9GAMM|nr:DUF2470 domain-containing protein [Agitococcus lubricus]PTQ90616.1 hypothetical protein C8N29_10214 [Agitococcus lubricus]
MASLEWQHILFASYEGVLSTQSQQMIGYPFGSVVPFCLDNQGQVVILISELAQHTKNLKADAKCSLIMMAEGDDIQSAARLTVIGDAEPVNRDEVDVIAARYYRYFPQSQDFHRVHDFSFWRIKPVKYRYIGGFGQIHWLQPHPISSPFSAEVEQDMIQHMNEDHADTFLDYCRLVQVTVPAHADLTMVSLNPMGFHLRMNKRIVFVPFPEVVSTPAQVRAVLIALLKQARSLNTESLV